MCYSLLNQFCSIHSFTEKKMVCMHSCTVKVTNLKITPKKSQNKNCTGFGIKTAKISTRK